MAWKKADRIAARMRMITVACAFVSIGASLMVLLGWATDNVLLKSFRPEWVTMKPNTAFCFLLSGIALLGLYLRRHGAWFAPATRALSVFVVIIGALSLMENLFDWDFGIDALLFEDKSNALHSARPGLMGLNSSVAFVLMGSAFFLAQRRARSGHYTSNAVFWQSCLLIVNVLAVIALLGYVFGAPGIQALPSFTRMAVHTALVFTLLSLGGLCLVPRAGLANIVSGNTIGSIVFRRLVFPITAVPIFLGWIILYSMRNNLLDTAFGITLLVVLIMLVLLSVLAVTAALLNRLDAQRNALAEEIEESAQKLRQSEERYRAALENTGTGYVIVNDTGAVVEANAAYLTLAGVTHLEEIQGRSVIEWTAPEARAANAAAIEKTARAGHITDFETIYLQPDGSRKHISINATLEETPGGIRLVALCRDITARVNAQAELRTSEERFRTVMRHSPIGKAIVAPDGKWLDVNDSLCRILGYTREDLLASDFQTITHPDDLEKDLEQVRDMLERKIETYQMEKRYISKSGHMVWAQLNVALVWGDDEKPRHFISQVQDITERKRSEKLLTEFKAAMDHHAIVAITDQQGKITYANDHFCEISKYPREELIGQDHRILNSGHHPPEFMRNLWRTIANSGVWKGEIKNRAKDGTYYWVATTIVPFLTQSGKPYQYIAIRTDITAQKRTEELLEERAQQLEDSNRDLDDFTYIVSHDLKAPLRGIQSYSSFLIEDYSGKLDDNGKEKLRTLMRLAKRLESLLDSLHFYSRVGKAELAMRETDLAALVLETLDSLDIFLKEKGATVQIEGVLPKIVCDATRVGELFHNLMSNAAKYNDNPDKKITVGCRKEENAPPVFYVRDNGIGIPDKHKEKIFTIFKRLHAQDKYGGGTGSGLSISRKIVERHNGKIWVESGDGGGSTFYFTLPG